eukprot:Tamp_12910.p1 GENE.Tamp_12910~~Tamp_12910.p1  ORF type:complete len:519 (-),score=56.95 Tamp_12910:212-1768(-)
MLILVEVERAERCVCAGTARGVGCALRVACVTLRSLPLQQAGARMPKVREAELDDDTHNPHMPLTHATSEEAGHVTPNVQLSTSEGERKRCAAVRQRPKHAAAVTVLVAVIAVTVLATRRSSSSPSTSEFAWGRGDGEEGGRVAESQGLAAGPSGHELRSNACAQLAMGNEQDSPRWNAIKCDCLALADPEQAVACYVNKAVPLPPSAYVALDRGAGEMGAGGRGAAWEHTKKILSFGARSPGDPGWKLTHEYIWNTLQAQGWTMEEDSFTETKTPPTIGPKPMKNIVSSFHPEGGDCAIDLAAHYDSKYQTRYVFLGATDSAAPVGMMLALAEALTPALRKKLEAEGNMPCLRLVFFDGEEAFVRWTDGPDGDSIYGSKHLAAKWASQPDPYIIGAQPPRMRIQSMRAMALLDLLGAAHPQLTWHFSSTRTLFDHMQNSESRARAQGLMKGAGGSRSAEYLSTTGNRGAISDDHLPWLQRGVPILHLIASPFPSVWHTVNDNLSALDYETGTREHIL